MRSTYRTVVLLALIMLSVHIASAQTPSRSDDDAAAPIRTADIAFAQATGERGLDGWMSFFADDAYLGTNPAVRGRLELRRSYQNLFSRRDLKFEWTPEEAEIFPSGILGYTSGRYTMSYTTYEGKTASQTGSYLTVWQKQPDGSWKVLTDFGSQDKPKQPNKSD